MKLTALVPMPDPVLADESSVDYGINGVPALCLSFVGGQFFLYTIGYKVSSILRDGMQSRLLRSLEALALSIPVPAGMTDPESLIRSTDHDTLKNLLTDVVAVIEGPQPTTERGTFDELLLFFSDLASVTDRAIYLQFPNKQYTDTTVTRFAKCSDPAELRPLIRLAFEWARPIRTKTYLSRYKVLEEKIDGQTIIPRQDDTGHEALEATQRVQAFIDRAAKDLGIADKKRSKLLSSIGL